MEWDPALSSEPFSTTCGFCSPQHAWLVSESSLHLPLRMSAECVWVSIRSDTMIQREPWSLCLGSVSATNVMGDLGEVPLSGPQFPYLCTGLWQATSLNLVIYSQGGNSSHLVLIKSHLNYELVSQTGLRTPSLLGF